ncbi:stage 0 sporulation regulatory protein [Cytobacillus eiseniae]|uniref:Stage 0 sporulation regulatory protein n=1 Tax=Cytobacillus eiseniae TaxID=762947 RepID=A0ABS4RAJ8_9BACI|nr:aspartyl-phosphate phosphatase Spo0E family protein [Cytobacillus eiseniae]MBP2239915.1 stage 0 sporulation regulatory protein [Cytobacillus eiseniae]
MEKNEEEILMEIQKKREVMINIAKKHGYRSDCTIRCSEELDQLIYEYQREKHKDKKQRQRKRQKAKFSIKYLFTSNHENINPKYQLYS